MFETTLFFECFHLVSADLLHWAGCGSIVLYLNAILVLGVRHCLTFVFHLPTCVLDISPSPIAYCILAIAHCICLFPCHGPGSCPCPFCPLRRPPKAPLWPPAAPGPFVVPHDPAAPAHGKGHGSGPGPWDGHGHGHGHGHGQMQIGNRQQATGSRQ